MKSQSKNMRRRRLVASSYSLFKKTQRYVPLVVRGFMGVLLIIAGVAGFLPLLGFWMIPLGLAVLATDIPPLKKWLRKKIHTSNRPKHR